MTTMHEPHAPHDTHPDVVKRLKRAEGHLRTSIAMIEHGRPCVDIAQQLHAVEKAINKAKVILIQDHVDHCLERAGAGLAHDGRNPITEFKQIAKFL
jgi:DNA-binding FrmR family transcriptional regulator